MQKFLLPLVALLTFLSPVHGEDGGLTGTLPRYMQCPAEVAEFELTAIFSLAGVYQKESRTFYFRERREEIGLFSESFVSNADGEGTGYGLTAHVDPRFSEVEVEINTYWSSKVAHGNLVIQVPVQYLAAKSGKEAGFEYSFFWKKLKKANHTPEATPGQRPPTTSSPSSGAPHL